MKQSKQLLKMVSLQRKTTILSKIKRVKNEFSFFSLKPDIAAFEKCL